MMNTTRNGLLAALLASSLVFSAGSNLAMAAEGFSDKPHKIVIQVSTADPVTQKIALNNALALSKTYGPDAVAIEVVAYGPGLSLMTPKSAESKRIPDLAMQDIQFSACNNTIKKITKKTGKAPKLVEGVEIVPAGAVRIMELQENGYSYIRP
jgi:uncharacterized protein